ncbi:uncharacterized protein LOC116250836 [Nymphaea colorata]|nr:uncharacterized protein LOC116250836 [Nymphaea colorata]
MADPLLPDSLFLQVMSKRRTWVALFILVYALLLSFSWTFIRSILSWYSTATTDSSTGGGFRWPAVYASVVFGVVFGLLSMLAVLALAIPSMLVTWITILVLLAFAGKPRRSLVFEGRKITGEISGLALRIMLKEGNIVAALCAILSFYVLTTRRDD